LSLFSVKHPVQTRIYILVNCGELFVMMVEIFISKICFSVGFRNLYQIIKMANGWGGCLTDGLLKGNNHKNYTLWLLWQNYNYVNEANFWQVNNVWLGQFFYPLIFFVHDNKFNGTFFFTSVTISCSSQLLLTFHW
jgi:hypothetical protein